MICNKCNVNQVPPYRKTKCDPCAAADEAAFKAKNAGLSEPVNPPVDRYIEIEKSVKAENGEYQSTVYNRTVAANSYEVGQAGNRFKLYFETPAELKAKMQELRDAGLMDMPLDKVPLE